MGIAYLVEPTVQASEDTTAVRTDLRMWTDDDGNIVAVLEWWRRD